MAWPRAVLATLLLAGALPGGPAIRDDEPFIPYWAMTVIGLGAVGLMVLALRRARG